MQVQVNDIGADHRRTRQAHLGIHVGTVHVHLPTVLMNDRRDFADPLLEDPVRRGIRHHQHTQHVMMLLSLGPQVIDVDVPLRIAGDHDDPHARHRGAGGVRPVGGCRDQGHVARGLASVPVVGALDHQPGEFSLGARVRLERDAGQPRDGAEG